jgi:hypothetical protein
MLKSSHLKRAASSSPWGPIHFEGVNWRGNGALPFSIKSKTRFSIGFWATSAFFFFLPFYGNLSLLIVAVERKLWPQRVAKWNKAKEE